MSRASAGFADFFPTAPSVLQQKHKQAELERQRARKKAVLSHPAPGTHVDPGLVPSLDLTHEGVMVNGGVPGGGREHQHGSSQDDNESVQGDILNGVGSASSHTSTASSIFSGTNNVLTGSHLGVQSSTHTLTPLTNTESSPPERINSPSMSKPTYADRSDDQSTRVSSLVKVPDIAPRERLRMMALLEPRLRVQPPPGQAKGMICTYDPELDKTLSSKERKKLKPIYREFGLEVC